MFQLLPPDPAPGHPSPGTAREEAALAWTHRGLDGGGVREEEYRERTESSLMLKVNRERKSGSCLLTKASH